MKVQLMNRVIGSFGPPRNVNTPNIKTRNPLFSKSQQNFMKIDSGRKENQIILDNQNSEYLKKSI
jgi:hypothetical protein